MIKICRWVYGANAPDDGIVMEPAPREDRTGASSGHTRARAQAGRKVKSGRLLPTKSGYYGAGARMAKTASLKRDASMGTDATVECREASTAQV